MSNLPERFAAAAERCIGAPFRLHGRDPQFGLDCAGLVDSALRACGITPQAAPCYRLRNTDYGFLPALANSCGLIPTNGHFQRGNLLLVRPGPAQRHLLIAVSAADFIHAHAGLRRVVRQTGPLAWPLAAQWRFG